MHVGGGWGGGYGGFGRVGGGLWWVSGEMEVGEGWGCVLLQTLREALLPCSLPRLFYCTLNSRELDKGVCL